jgi:acyl-CoA thioester hydrolase
MPTKEFRITIVPRWTDIDANQHVRNTAFSEWAAYARSEWLASVGFDFKKLMDLKFSGVIFEDSTKYLQEIFLGEHIVVDLELVGLKLDGSQFHVRHLFRRDGTVCAVHDVKGAWLDIASRRVAVPPRGVFEASISLLRANDYAEIVAGAKGK